MITRVVSAAPRVLLFIYLLARGLSAQVYYQIQQVQPQPVTAGANLSVYGMFPTGAGTPTVTLENNGVTVATLPTVSNSASTLAVTVPAGTASGTYLLKAAFGASPVFKYPGVAIGASTPVAPQFSDLGGGLRRVVAEGGSITLNPTVSGAASFQWLRNGRSIPGATNQSYTISSAVPETDAGWYQLVASAGADKTTPTRVSTPVFVVVSFQSAVTPWGGAMAAEKGVLSAPTDLTDAVAIASGPNHILALRAGGTVLSWGWTSDGATAVPAGLTDIVAVSAGDQLSAALRADGTVFTWGFGAGAAEPAAVPSSLGRVVAISAGAGHILALRADGTVAAWGRNGSGQTNVPTDLNGVVAVAAGSEHSLALRTDGSVVAWGGGTTGSGVNVVPSGLASVGSIAAGMNRNVAIKFDGSTTMWGDTTTFGGASLTDVRTASVYGGGLAVHGNGSVERWGSTATLTIPWVSSALPSSVVGVVSVAAGSDHAVALRRTASGSGAAPVVIYSNYTGALSTSSSLAKQVTSSRRVAVKFSPTTTATFTSARVNMEAVTAGTTAPVKGYICADETNTPGTQLAVMGVTPVSVRNDYSFPMAAGNPLVLTAGNNYWFVVEADPAVSGTAAYWHGAGTDQLNLWGYAVYSNSTWTSWVVPTVTSTEPAKALQIFGTTSGGGGSGGTTLPPAITSTLPNPVAPASQLTVTGTNFPTGGVVKMELMNATTSVSTLTGVSATATQVVGTVPSGAPSGTYTLKVTFGDGSTATATGIAVGTSGGSGGSTNPVLGAVTPSTLVPGSLVTIAGSNLPTTVTPTVTLVSGGNVVGTLTNVAVTATQITGNVPANVAAGNYTLRVQFSAILALEKADVPVGSGGGGSSGSGATALVSGVGPQTQTLPDASKVALGVVVVSSSAPTYTWSKGTASVGTGSSYTFTLGASTAGSYSVAVPGSGTMSTSLSVAGTAGSQPNLLTGLPRAVYAQTGRYVVLGLSAAGGSNLGFSWSKDSVALAGKTDQVLDLGVPTSTAAGLYTVGVQLGTDLSTQRSSTTRLIVGAGGDALLYGPSAPSAAIGSRLAISGSMVPGDGAAYVWERKPAGTSTFAAVTTTGTSPYSVANSPAGTELTIDAVTSSMVGDQFRFVATRGGISFTSEPYTLLGGGTATSMAVEGTVRAWSPDLSKVGAVVSGQTFNVFSQVYAGLGTSPITVAAPSNWGRVLNTANLSSLSGESGVTFKFGALSLNNASFISGAGGANGGITLQEYIPSATAQTPVEFYDSTGAVLVKGYVEKLVVRVNFNTGIATAEAGLVLNTAGAATKAPALLAEIQQLTGQTGRLQVIIDSFTAITGNSQYCDYLSKGTIVPAAALPAPRHIFALSTLANVPATGSQIAFTIPPGANKRVLVRAVVSPLPALGVSSGAMADPQLVLKNAGGTALAVNDTWSLAANAAEVQTVSTAVQAAALPSGSTDAVILVELAPGAYTVDVKGAGGGSGKALVELYAADNASTTTFSSVAFQGPAGGTEAAQTVGFVLGGSETNDVLVRAVGPSLASGGLADPRLGLFYGNTQIAANDNWDGLRATSNAFTQAGGLDFAPGSKDSAILLRLGNGAYVTTVSAPAGAASGVVRTEITLLGAGSVDSLIHTADLDRNGRISLTELTRVIELYNTRNGTNRTGFYAVSTGASEDGFAAAPGTSTRVAPSRRHSADSNGDGEIGLSELTRVIELYNYRSGTTRTGDYKPSAGTEDGFAPGS
jgi:alpha-tubulin suppressor-like RCC1 family protein